MRLTSLIIGRLKGRVRVVSDLKKTNSQDSVRFQAVASIFLVWTLVQKKKLSKISDFLFFPIKKDLSEHKSFLFNDNF